MNEKPILYCGSRELDADKERLDFIERNVRQAHVNGHHRVELTIFTARDVEQKGLRATIDAARNAEQTKQKPEFIEWEDASVGLWQI